MWTLELAAPVRLLAPAKVNLGLEILGRRIDGYHEVVTLMQAIDLTDTLDLLPAATLTYDGIPGIHPDDDLVWRALTVASDDLGIALRAEIRITKGIPVSAGLGGGSSDAGTLLGALAAWAGLTPEDAEAAAARLGSDVPFFIRGGTALATGTGTTLEHLPDPPGHWFVLVTPRLDIPRKTAALYGELTPGDYTDGGQTRQQAARLRATLPTDPSLLHNSFARPVLARPAIRAAHDALRAGGAPFVQVSGAGPSLYAPLPDHPAATSLAARLGEARGTVHVCATLGADLNAGAIATASTTTS